jgi:colicin import membrane protein
LNFERIYGLFLGILHNQAATAERERLTARRLELIQLLESEWVAKQRDSAGKSISSLKREQSTQKRLAKTALKSITQLAGSIDAQDTNVATVAQITSNLTAFAASSTGKSQEELRAMQIQQALTKDEKKEIAELQKASIAAAKKHDQAYEATRRQKPADNASSELAEAAEALAAAEAKLAEKTTALEQAAEERIAKNAADKAAKKAADAAVKQKKAEETAAKKASDAAAKKASDAAAKKEAASAKAVAKGKSKAKAASKQEAAVEAAAEEVEKSPALPEAAAAENVDKDQAASKAAATEDVDKDEAASKAAAAEDVDKDEAASKAAAAEDVDKDRASEYTYTDEEDDGKEQEPPQKKQRLGFPRRSRPKDL